MMFRFLVLGLVLVAFGCGTDDASVPVDMGADVNVQMDVGVSDAAVLPDSGTDAQIDTAPDMPVLEVIASNYCELTAQMFCDYYLRCGRMAVPDNATCLSVFAETCEGVYEPHYAALAEAGSLTLSSTGMAACAAHLESVACEKQLFDLDGGCSEMWVGTVAPDGICAPGIESFVCEPTSTCVITTTGCGTCIAAGRDGAPCGGDLGRCDDGYGCVESACVKRGSFGDACSPTAPCGIGMGCIDDTCGGFTVVALGAACGQGLRCPYNSFCQDNVCVPQKGLGESCSPTDDCRSGYCEQGACVAFKPDGGVCNSGPQCVSGVCNQGICGNLPGRCFE